jgi:hypothetical protein
LAGEVEEEIAGEEISWGVGFDAGLAATFESN